MTEILAVDPGKRTGIVLVHFSDDAPAHPVASWDVPGGLEGWADWITEHQESFVHSDFFIVYERFIPREGTHGVGTDAPEVIGALCTWAKDWGIPAVPQPPAGRMKAVPNKVLDKFYPFKGKAERNEKEAFRHAIWYLKNAKHIPTITKGWLDE